MVRGTLTTTGWSVFLLKRQSGWVIQSAPQSDCSVRPVSKTAVSLQSEVTLPCPDQSMTRQYTRVREPSFLPAYVVPGVAERTLPESHRSGRPLRSSRSEVAAWTR